MPSTITNTMLDTLGILRALTYRIFIERNWKQPQPMFNILNVKEGDVTLFEEFLRQSLSVSIKDDTPLSLGPFKTIDRTFIYITHYASSMAFLKVMRGLLFGGEAKMRAKATLKTSWTYCKSNQESALQTSHNITMIGLQGAPNRFISTLIKSNFEVLGSVKKIKDVRGNSLDNYFFFESDQILDDFLKEQIKNGEDIKIYKAKRIQ